MIVPGQINTLSGLRGKAYYTTLRKLLKQYGAQLVEEARRIKPMTILSIGRLALKYGLNFKATCKWLEESQVIPTGSYCVMKERGLKVSKVFDEIREERR